MATKLAVEFLHDWLKNPGKLREKVLHKERTEMKNYGLDDPQIDVLREFKLSAIAKLMCDELGVDLKDLRMAVYGLEEDDPFGAGGAAAYNEGRTHIRRTNPTVAPVNTAQEFTLLGHGFKSDPTKVVVQFLTGPPATQVIVAGTVTEVTSSVDVWQRVTVTATLTQVGEWAVRAHNDDEAAADNGNPLWSEPMGKVHVF